MGVFAVALPIVASVAGKAISGAMDKKDKKAEAPAQQPAAQPVAQQAPIFSGPVKVTTANGATIEGNARDIGQMLSGNAVPNSPVPAAQVAPPPLPQPPQQAAAGNDPLGGIMNLGKDLIGGVLGGIGGGISL